MAKTDGYQRAADYVSGIGENLDALKGRDVLLHSFEVSQRPMRGQQTTFVSMKISEVDQPDTIAEYHAWSSSLGEKLTQLDKNPDVRYPVLVEFKKDKTAGGNQVWTFA